MNLLFERKQIPRIVVNVRNSQKPIDRLEPISLPWAQGVGRSNRPAPTNTSSYQGFSLGLYAAVRQQRGKAQSLGSISVAVGSGLRQRPRRIQELP